MSKDQNGGYLVPDELEREISRQLVAVSPIRSIAKLRIAAVTPDPQRSNMDWFSAMETDRLFRVPTLRLLDAQAAHRDDTRGFQFTWTSQQFGVPMGACHVIDVPFVFGVTDTPAGMFFTGGGEPARALAAEVQKVWGDFAHGRAVQGPAWKDTRRVRQFGPGDAEAALLDADGEALWADIIPVPGTAKPGQGA